MYGVVQIVQMPPYPTPLEPMGVQLRSIDEHAPASSYHINLPLHTPLQTNAYVSVLSQLQLPM